MGKRVVSPFDEATMTEQDWLTCSDSTPMLEYLQTRIADPLDPRFDAIDSSGARAGGMLSWKAAQRKLWLFACACMRQTELFRGPDHLHAIRTSEQFADGLVDRAALEAAFVPTRKLPEPIPHDADMALSVFGPTDMVWEARLIEVFSTLGPDLDVRLVARKAAEIITESEGGALLSRRARNARSDQANLLRDIFGNPFRPVHLDTSRLTAKTRSLAKSIYDAGRFAKLPQLAKALKQDAGPVNQDLLDHCEWPIPHVRGCWAVDLVSGKA
jgi:hypothetical protein